MASLDGCCCLGGSDELQGFVGILRQLGDLAQLAAEVFQGLHDEAMATSARGHHLALRLMQLDKDFVCSCQSTTKEHCLLVVASNKDQRVHWRADIVVKQGVVAGGKMPSFIFESIDRCRGPPKLSPLDKYDAQGEGACLKRYTNPSFFRSDSACSTKLGIQMAKTSQKVQETRPTLQCSDNSRPSKPVQYSDSMPEIDASQGCLSMSQQLKKFRQANETHNFQSDEASSQKNDSSTVSPASSIKVTEDITVVTGSISELERTSSFGAWLSPSPLRDEITEEEEAPRCSFNNGGLVSHAADTKKADCEKDYCTFNKKAVSKRSRYKGGVEFIAFASRVSSLPRKLFTNLLELKCDAVRGSDSCATASARGGCDNGKRQLEHELDYMAHPVGVGLAASSSPPHALFHASAGQHRYREQHTKTASCEDQSDDPCEACYDALLEELLHQSNAHQELNGCALPTKLWSSSRSMPGSMTLLDGALHELTGVLPGNASSQGAVPPLPPMQWLSAKAHSETRVESPKLEIFRPQSPATAMNHAAGSNCLHQVRKQLEAEIFQESILSSHTEMAQVSASDVKSTAHMPNRDGTCRHESPEKDFEEIHHRESFRKGALQPSEGEILNTGSELAEKKPDPNAEIQFRREEKHKVGNEDSGRNENHNIKLSTEKLSESYEDLYPMGNEISATCRCSNEPQLGVQNSLDHPTEGMCNSSVHADNVFTSAVEQLTKMNPPYMPRPKHSLIEVGTGPGWIYPSRKLSGDRSILLEQINDKSYNLKPVLGRGSNVTDDHRISKVATIVQKADQIRQAHANDNDIDSEDSWGDSD